jgi:hypothetical protein
MGHLANPAAPGKDTESGFGLTKKGIRIRNGLPFFDDALP